MGLGLKTHILACERFGQWPFDNPASQATMSQLVLLAEALKQDRQIGSRQQGRSNKAPRGKLPKKTWRQWKERFKRE